MMTVPRYLGKFLLVVLVVNEMGFQWFIAFFFSVSISRLGYCDIIVSALTC